ncbi:Fe-Mn family superoxide dismutase, partial [Streptomyces hoynatensis]
QRHQLPLNHPDIPSPTQTVTLTTTVAPSHDTPQHHPPTPASHHAHDPSQSTRHPCRKEFSKAATGHFGSGWAWLVLNLETHEPEIVTTHDAQTPLAASTAAPLPAVDVWEHAHYIDSRNERARCLDAIRNIVNWKFANEHLAKHPPVPEDQAAHRRRRGSRVGRPPAFNRQTHRDRNRVELHQPLEAMARPGHAHGQTLPPLPRRTPPRQHPHPAKHLIHQTLPGAVGSPWRLPSWRQPAQ